MSDRLTAEQIDEAEKAVSMTDPETQEVCVFCLDDYTVDFGKDDTGFCHNCASDRMSQLLPLMPALIATARREAKYCEALKRIERWIGGKSPAFLAVQDVARAALEGG